ncbi:hypothetical protein SAMN05660835_01173 [Desulfurella multipotens]|uniref:Uncharacterized protein n=1 Tax=Desulfurella multipotens TaxID=79269 RepID=A0A1G6NEW0_9BACT|nr:hypothetical protein [Desulfurella multipotens]SDC65735.1 hypothetical protein SAMN05660835_01173 [Desulfurella multipotens]
MGGDFTTLPGYIIGGGDLITFEEIRKKVESLGKIVDIENQGFRLIPYSKENEKLDFDEMYPVIYFNKDYTIDIYISFMKFEKVIEFMQILSDTLGVPIEHADNNGTIKKTEEDIEMLEEFYKNLGGGLYGRSK